MSDDEALTKRAIEEILREASENRVQGNARIVENKINPLVKPNKNFLGRTVKSVMAHNERQNERIMKNCRVKLQEMDMAKEKAKQREKQRYVAKHEEQRRDRRHKYTKKQSKRKTVKREREERVEDNANDEQEYSYPDENYIDENINYADVYYDLAQAALESHAYHQVGKWLCFQTLLSDTYKPPVKRKKVPARQITILSSESEDSLDMTDNVVDLTCEDVEEDIPLYNDNHLEHVSTDNECIAYIDLCSDTENDADINVSSAVECQLAEIPASDIINIDSSSDEDD